MLYPSQRSGRRWAGSQTPDKSPRLQMLFPAIGRGTTSSQSLHRRLDLAFTGMIEYLATIMYSEILRTLVRPPAPQVIERLQLPDWRRSVCHLALSNSSAVLVVLAMMMVVFQVGCGTTRSQEATEQLVLSSAVDNSIAAIDFRPLTGQRVYFDDTYIKGAKTPSWVNGDYVISSLRQQIMAAGCLLQDKADTADIVIEGRVGTLGSDDHRVTYGVPENNVLGVAATFLSPIPARAPTMPEIAVARRDAREGAAKVAAFAYHRETRQPLWQSGISKSIATSQNTWVMGVGPFQGGSIRDSSKVARNEAKTGAGYVRNGKDVNHRPPVSYSAEMRFDNGWPLNGRPVPIATPPAVASKPDLPPELTRRPTDAESGLMGEPVVNGVVDQPQTPSIQR